MLCRSTVGEVISIPTLRDGARTGYTAVGWGVDPNNAIYPGTVFTADIAAEWNLSEARVRQIFNRSINKNQ